MASAPNALLREIRAGQPRVEVIRELLAGGAELPDRDLQRLCANQQYDVLRAFLDAGMDPNRVSKDESTLLIEVVIGLVRQIHWVLKRGAAQVHDLPRYIEPLRAFVGDLLGRGARVNDQDATGATALIVLCGLEYGLSNGAGIALVQDLLAAGADVNVADKEGRTALHHVLANHSLQQFTPEGVELVQVLLEADAEVNAVDNEGYTPLLLLASHELLQDDEAEFNRWDLFGAVYDEDLAFQSRGEILEILMSYAADPTATVGIPQGYGSRQRVIPYNALRFAANRDNEAMRNRLVNYVEMWKEQNRTRRARYGLEGGQRRGGQRRTRKGRKSRRGRKSRKSLKSRRRVRQ